MLKRRAMPLITWLGGACCTPRALRRSDNTTTIFTKEERIIIRKGNVDMKTIAVDCVMSDGLSNPARFVISSCFGAVCFTVWAFGLGVGATAGALSCCSLG